MLKKTLKKYIYISTVCNLNYRLFFYNCTPKGFFENILN